MKKYFNLVIFITIFLGFILLRWTLELKIEKQTETILKNIKESSYDTVVINNPYYKVEGGGATANFYMYKFTKPKVYNKQFKYETYGLKNYIIFYTNIKKIDKFTLRQIKEIHGVKEVFVENYEITVFLGKVFVNKKEKISNEILDILELFSRTDLKRR